MYPEDSDHPDLPAKPKRSVIKYTYTDAESRKLPDFRLYKRQYGTENVGDGAGPNKASNLSAIKERGWIALDPINGYLAIFRAWTAVTGPAGVLPMRKYFGGLNGRKPIVNPEKFYAVKDC